jgi:hypothetical protein
MNRQKLQEMIVEIFGRRKKEAKPVKPGKIVDTETGFVWRKKTAVKTPGQPTPSKELQSLKRTGNARMNAWKDMYDASNANFDKPNTKNQLRADRATEKYIDVRGRNQSLIARLKGLK